MTQSQRWRAPAAADPTSVPGDARSRPAQVVRSSRLHETVTAVVVTRGVTQYLPETLAAVARQRRPPQQLLVVDGAHDARPGALAAAPELQAALAALGHVVPTRLVAAPGVRTFGGAVRAALARETGSAQDGSTGDGDRADRTAWVWLLHDDSAPEPDALAALVGAVEVAPSVAVAGAKQLTWDEPARLLSVGWTTSRFGRRMTGVDEPEVDQGQHDAREDVLAVGLAGALVRRDVWDRLGGPDPALGPYGDGLDLSRRARLAGHRVVVVPRAVVRHAQATLSGGRPDWDQARCERVRREAFVHGQLTSVPGWLVPVVILLAIASGPVRALWRLAMKEPHLVVGELVAPWRVLAAPGRIVRARRRARAVAVLPRRALRPLQASWRDVVSQLQDRRLTAAEARRTRTAPSELELAELRVLRARRRWTLGGVALVAVVLDLVVFGGLIGPVLGGARLTGGTLGFGDADLGGLWSAASSWWNTTGLGQAAPPEPLLAALVPLAAVTGGVGGATALVMLGSFVLAALGAWFAAGAATRSVTLRAWAAAVWVAAPALLVSIEQARLGAVLAHVTLPWFLLALARGVGVARTDSVASGLVGAKRLVPRAPVRAGTAAVDAAPARPRYTFDADADAEVRDAPEDLAPAGDTPDADAGSHPVADDPEAAPGTDPDAVAEEPVVDLDHLAVDEDPDVDPPAGPVGVPAGLGRPPATGVAEPSLAAGAAAGLVLVVLSAAAPVLLPAVLVLLLAIAPVVRRRARLLWIPVPALAMHGPVLAEAFTSWTDGGWRLLLADPGRPVTGDVAPAWQQALGWPVPAESWLPVPWEGAFWQVAPLVASGLVLVLALPALWLRTPVGRAARVGWVTVAIGTAAGLAASRTVTAVAVTGEGPVTTAASAAPGLSLALAGALTAALVGAAGVRSALARQPLGLRHAAVGVLLLAAAAGPCSLLVPWVLEVHGDDGGTGRMALDADEVPAVPTVGRQLQSSGLRVLQLTPAPGGVGVTLLEGNGPQLTQTSRVVELRRLLSTDPAGLSALAGRSDRSAGADGADDAALDAADVELVETAVALAAGAATDAPVALADLGVGAVLVPPGGDAEATALTAALDSTAGLERVTSTDAGVIWRVTGATSGAVGRLRVVQGAAADGETLLALPEGEGSLLPPGTGGRTLVLAERADDGWHATLNGRALRSVETTWRQAFELPADGGRLSVTHRAAQRLPWAAVQSGVLLVTLLLAVPLRRRKAVR